MDFEILTPPPLPMKEGALIDYRIRMGVLPLRWRTLITTFDPPHRFVDEQLAGPYDLWHHEHRFIERDAAPRFATSSTTGCPSGRWVNWLIDSSSAVG